MKIGQTSFFLDLSVGFTIVNCSILLDHLSTLEIEAQSYNSSYEQLSSDSDYGMQFKILVTINKTIYGLGPGYLSPLVFTLPSWQHLLLTKK